MTPSLYFGGADATITADSTAIGAVDGWSFSISWERNDKYTSDSIFMRASAKYRRKIEVKLKSATFDPSVSGTWWVLKSIRGGGDTGEDKNAEPVSMGSIADTSKLAYFDVVGTVIPFSADEGVAKLCATATDCYLDSFPIEVKAGEWTYMDLTAYAASIVFTNPA